MQKSKSVETKKTDDLNARFVELANPHSWFLMADNLHEQAKYLHQRRGRMVMVLRQKSRVLRKYDLVDNSVFLLGGFALENAIKAFLVYENPQWISNGKMAKQLKSHSLTSLQQQSARIPYKRRYQWVLGQFEEGIESWARYPCGLSIDCSALEREMHATLWDGYLRVMSAYGRRLKELLSSGWRGPNGFDGYWVIKGKYFE